MKNAAGARGSAISGNNMVGRRLQTRGLAQPGFGHAQIRRQRRCHSTRSPLTPACDRRSGAIKIIAIL
jgi:hypothetical protein